MFKDKLKELREKAGLSQYELASKLFVSRSAIAKWENGNGVPSDINLETICKFFDVDEETLLEKKDLKDIVRNYEIYKRNINVLSFVLILCITIFCFFIGGSYHLHRIAILFTFGYFILKFWVKKNIVTKISSIIFLILGILISVINWLITGIPEPSHLFRVFTGYTNEISLSQLSSIINIFMIVSYNVILYVIKRLKK